MEYGGGYFGYANIYSLDKDSNFYLFNHNDIPITQYLRIANNGCGDDYLLCIENKKCLDQIFFYDHETKKVCDTEFADVLEYLINIGLKEKIKL